MGSVSFGSKQPQQPKPIIYSLSLYLDKRAGVLECPPCKLTSSPHFGQIVLGLDVNFSNWFEDQACDIYVSFEWLVRGVREGLVSLRAASLSEKKKKK